MSEPTNTTGLMSEERIARMKPPKARYEVSIQFGAHSVDEVQAKLRQLQTDFSLYGVRSNVSSWTGITEVTEHPDQTEENYNQELDHYCQFLKDRS